MADRMRVTSDMADTGAVEDREVSEEYSRPRDGPPASNRQASKRTGDSPRLSPSPPQACHRSQLLREICRGSDDLFRGRQRIAEHAVAVLGLGKQRVRAGGLADGKGIGPDARAALGGVAQQGVG